ncbi:hypothetical protein [Streptomyces sp. AC627_RSS907]|uniref:hypothetical protein n=1 Tax=Streptomyces sp. AC627_RSS907 TaxID=2823684 RepID=UPI001C238B91|nr:hypothetical protein [Streptomyces sp. AC627_RSS907]
MVGRWAVPLWAGWLGWDQQWDVRPDGSTSGPYEAWQVVGPVVSLLVPVGWVVFRCHVAAVVFVAVERGAGAVTGL